MVYIVFISHSVSDIDTVEKIADLLEDYGIESYIAERDLQYGNYLSDKIRINIDNSDAVLVLWTNNSHHSDWVNQEIGYAVKAGKKIIPLIEKGVRVKGFLEGREYLDMDSYNMIETMENVGDYLDEYRDEKEQLETLAVISGLAAGIIGLVALSNWLNKK